MRSREHTGFAGEAETIWDKVYKHTPVYEAKGNRSKERSRFQKARQISEVLPKEMRKGGRICIMLSATYITT